MELREALNQISEIREHLAKTEVFRGYRSATALFTAGLAIVGAVAQGLWIAEPGKNFTSYCVLWGLVATLSIALTAIEMTTRYFKNTSPIQRESTLQAAGQMVPALIAGALATVMIGHVAHYAVWMMPGLWCMFFGLGIFSSRRVFPRMITWVGQYYLLAGMTCLGLEWTSMSPWVMGIAFGLGQLQVAAILYFKLERQHVR